MKLRIFKFISSWFYKMTSYDNIGFVKVYETILQNRQNERFLWELQSRHTFSRLLYSS